MNREQIAGRLTQIVGRMKTYWGVLAEDPALEAAGRLAQRAGKIREQRGVIAAHEERQLSEFLQTHRDWQNLAASTGTPAHACRHTQAGRRQSIMVISSR